MQTSRSVRKPTGLPCSSTTGTAPQGVSHIICAALLSESCGPQLLTSRFIICSTFIANPPKRKDTQPLPNEHHSCHGNQHRVLCEECRTTTKPRGRSPVFHRRHEARGCLVERVPSVTTRRGYELAI